MRFVAVGNITLHYRLDGLKTGPALVFLHSLGTELRIWDEVIPYFAQDFKIIRYDLRGHGLSDCPPGPYTVHHQVDDLSKLLTYLEVETSIIVGISVSGLIAALYAATQPTRVRALVLADTGLTIGPPTIWADRIEKLQHDGMKPMLETIQARWFGPSFAAKHPLEYRAYTNMLTRMPLEGYMATCATLRDTDLTESASMITAKTLVLCGSEDVSTPPDLCRTLAATLPDARFALINGAGHLPCVEQSNKMATLIMGFFQENAYVGSKI
jgi:3-oxoadipate enol-lactonase